MTGKAAIAWIAAWVACAGCGGAGGTRPETADGRTAPTETGTPTETATATETGTPTETATATETASSPPTTTLPNASLLLTTPSLLRDLESRGLAFHRILGASAPSAAALARDSAIYRDFARFIRLDDSVARSRDPEAGFGFGRSHRLFDPTWLESRRAFFELVAIVNRTDRIFATPGACGEKRLIYRLAYENEGVRSRLPMTINVVFAQRGDCVAIARAWLALDTAAERALADAVMAGPFAGALEPVRLESNFQSGRWPSAVRPAFGGHAEYVLRSFRVEGGGLAKNTLENNPTQTLSGSELRGLRAWILDHLAEIDRGEAVLPEVFLAERAVSVSPRGLSRLANRPYSQLFPDPGRAFASASFEGLTRVRSAAGLLRRLDEMSCKGCHQSRSLAGFHLLGEDPPETSPFNAVAVGTSPHLQAELPWRTQVLHQLAEGARPLRSQAEGARPFASRVDGDGLWGEVCGLGDPTFAGWRCGPGLLCEDRHGDLVGQCAHAAGNAIGDAVESGQVTQDRDALRDTLTRRTLEACAPMSTTTVARAESSSVVRAAESNTVVRAAESSDGFPGGMCHAPCTTLGEASAATICGSLPFGQGAQFGGFTRCLSEHRRAFAECLADDAHPTLLARCDASNPCREDYLCARVQGAEPGVGGCVPPYFLFQVRVDGHLVDGPTN